ncbi:MAG: hypothetical protein DRG20_03725 [Deltaproteobacteria bacterium]|nr:MAG: hypothetical protein DRG20_03725 [Deltaproteobacteria bacterium]
MFESKVLLVDDDPFILKALTKSLKKEIDLIETSESGEEALRKLDKECYHLVLADYKMPGMNGLEFLEKVKNLYPDTIRMMITMHSDIKIVMDAINQGEVYRFITKPWNTKELKSTIRQALSLAKLIEENKQMQQYIKNLIESSFDPIVVLNMEKKIQIFNKAAQDLSGYSLDEVKGKELKLLIDKNDMKKILDMLNHSDSPCRLESTIFKKDGKTKSIEISASRLKDSAKKIIGTICFVRDISEKKRLEAFKKEYETIVRHDLKNPLTSIIGYSDFLIKYIDKISKKEIKEFLNTIHKSGKNLLELIEASLDVDKLERGAFKKEYKKSDFIKILKKSLLHMDYLLKEKNVDIKILLNGAPLKGDETLEADINPTLIMRSLDNLIKNGIEASPKNGKVNIKISTNNDSLTVSIHNKEPISPEIQEHIFEPYSTFGKKGGSGLGLYGTKMAIDFHDGKINFTSTPEKGTTFTFTIPRFHPKK